MKVSVTREEIDRSAKVLAQLRQYEALLNIRERYARGFVSISIDGNSGKESVRIDCDSCGPRHPGGPQEVLDHDISRIVSTAVEDAIANVIARIKQDMPIPLDK